MNEEHNNPDPPETPAGDNDPVEVKQESTPADNPDNKVAAQGPAEKPADAPAAAKAPDPGADPTGDGEQQKEIDASSVTGDVANVVGVKFRRASKTYYFDAAHLRFSIGEQVIVETDRGLGLARVMTPVMEMTEKETPAELKRVIRKANWNDQERDRKNKEREKEAADLCLKNIRGRSLNMKLVRVEYFHDASKAIFYFTAEQRVDFRELVKDLARQLHTRIEMRQIGVRDETKMIGGLGPCGRSVCCATFLTDFMPVSVRMAKDQNLAMNPAKVSGLCGRLMCCLSYEHKLYTQNVKGMPKKGKKMDSKYGPCRVVDLNVLARQVLIELESGKTTSVTPDDLAPPGQFPDDKRIPPPGENSLADLDVDSEIVRRDNSRARDKNRGDKRQPRGRQRPQRGRGSAQQPSRDDKKHSAKRRPDRGGPKGRDQSADKRSADGSAKDTGPGKKYTGPRPSSKNAKRGDQAPSGSRPYQKQAKSKSSDKAPVGSRPYKKDAAGPGPKKSGPGPKPAPGPKAATKPTSGKAESKSGSDKQKPREGGGGSRRRRRRKRT